MRINLRAYQSACASILARRKLRTHSRPRSRTRFWRKVQKGKYKKTLETCTCSLLGSKLLPASPGIASLHHCIIACFEMESTIACFEIESTRQDTRQDTHARLRWARLVSRGSVPALGMCTCTRHVQHLVSGSTGQYGDRDSTHACRFHRQHAHTPRRQTARTHASSTDSTRQRKRDRQHALRHTPGVTGSSILCILRVLRIHREPRSSTHTQHSDAQIITIMIR